uniref:Uncharacterized protein n=1 Tax=Rhizochromulina marina TaxID=1034831 RepID=A0A7S2R4M3_9STRA|mmetsp:Transcript_10738/g.30805  ORF Transcript_10738/g.30805 Transcript_10738/m.30805 type:complete len:143 (+) Transcript_10738:343-771(+)
MTRAPLGLLDEEELLKLQRAGLPSLQELLGEAAAGIGEHGRAMHPVMVGDGSEGRLLWTRVKGTELQAALEQSLAPGVSTGGAGKETQDNPEQDGAPDQFPSEPLPPVGVQEEKESGDPVGGVRPAEDEVQEQLKHPQVWVC